MRPIDGRLCSTAFHSITIFMAMLRAGEVDQQLRVLTAHQEDLSQIPRTLFRQLTTACNLNSRDPFLASVGTAYMYPSTHTQTRTFFFMFFFCLVGFDFFETVFLYKSGCSVDI